LWKNSNAFRHGGFGFADGSYLFTIRSGWKPIEFDKGKSAIVVLSYDKLPAIIDTCKSQADDGGRKCSTVFYAG